MSQTLDIKQDSDIREESDIRRIPDIRQSDIKQASTIKRNIRIIRYCMLFNKSYFIATAKAIYIKMELVIGTIKKHITEL